jgi:uncharacterized protein (DUF427 family)
VAGTFRPSAYAGVPTTTTPERAVTAADPAPHRFTGRVPAGVVPVMPGPGEESVWDYPRPPRVEAVPERIRVVDGGIAIADSTRAIRVLETAGAPVYYVPPDDVRTDLLAPTSRVTHCEWKGDATYWTVTVGDRSIEDVAWSYEQPKAGFEPIAGYLAFYAAKVDEAWVGDERATPQPGGYYGGWMTSRIVGPVKGEPGSAGW